MKHISQSWFAGIATGVLAAVGLIAVVWRTDTPEPTESAMIQTFMALGPPERMATKQEPVPVKKCIPCGQRNGKLLAGSVPSSPPRHPTDTMFQAITGRDATYKLPHEAGTAPRLSERPTHGWVTMLVGPPLTQFRCYAEIDQKLIRLSRWSDATFPSEVIVSLTDPVPPSVPADAHVIATLVHNFFAITEQSAQTWSVDQVCGDLRIVSVTPALVVLIPQNHSWQPDQQEDVQLRLTPTGRVAHFAAVHAHQQADGNHAYRVLWFPDYATP